MRIPVLDNYQMFPVPLKLYPIHVFVVCFAKRTILFIKKMTFPTAPSAPPANIKHLNLTETEVSFQWDEVPCGSRGGVIAEYSYELTTSSGISRTATTTARYLSFNDLLPCTDYKFKVAATTSIDVGTYTEEIEFTTLTKGILIIMIIIMVYRI